MNTLGWVFVLVAGLIVRGVTKGRSLTQIPTDLGDEFMAVITSDPAKLKEVLARTGTSVDPSSSAGVVVDPTNTSALGVPRTPPATGTNPYDINKQRTQAAYNAAHPSGTGTRTSGGQVAGP